MQTDDSIEALRGCIQRTDWGIFTEAYLELDDYPDVVASYISWCESTCTEIKAVTPYDNDKPSFSGDI